MRLPSGDAWAEMSVPVIRSAGHEVDPLAVEQRLAEHPAVLDAVVVGKPDALRGEMVKAYVVLRFRTATPEATESELTRFVELRLPFHAAPREIEFVDALPRNAAGEVERERLRVYAPRGVL